MFILLVKTLDLTIYCNTALVSGFTFHLSIKNLQNYYIITL